MKFSEHWLRATVPLEQDTKALAEKLTMLGIEVESQQPAGVPLAGVVVAEILSGQPVDDAENLYHYVLNVGDDVRQVVSAACGLPIGQRVPLALVGAHLPTDLKINERTFSGVCSEGMLCSEYDLGLSEDASKIRFLDSDAPIGSPLDDYLGLNDLVWSVAITPNRGDCLSLWGIARELAGAYGLAWSLPVFDPVSTPASELVSVDVLDREACPQYTGRVIRNVTAYAPSPDWMQERLRRAGVRRVGLVVDVCNYIMLLTGQPMHAFDQEKIGDLQIRWAQSGEKINLLDGQAVTLDEDVLVVADHRPLAIAGIMGGIDSAISESTQHVFLESAHFVPSACRGRARRYGLQSESATRFERGVSPILPQQALLMATELILRLGGGEAGPITTVETTRQPHMITLRPDAVTARLGTTIPEPTMLNILKSLGFKCLERDDTSMQFEVPAHRFDCEIEEDLVEELARVHGYDQIPNRLPNFSIKPSLSPGKLLEQTRLLEFWAARGYQEIMTYSFISAVLSEKVAPDHTPIRLDNPMSPQQSVLRPSLWPGMLQAAHYNLARQRTRFRAFEQGSVFDRDRSGAVVQKQHLAGVILGARYPLGWQAGSEDADFFDIKGDIEAMLAYAGWRSPVFVRKEAPMMHPGQCASIVVNDQMVGLLGAFHPDFMMAAGLKQQAFGFELNLDSLKSPPKTILQPISKFPSIRRDLAVLVDGSVAASDIVACIKGSSDPILQEVQVFDVYQGKNLPSGQKSIALALTLQHPSRTLIEQDVADLLEQLMGAMQASFGAKMRE